MKQSNIAVAKTEDTFKPNDAVILSSPRTRVVRLPWGEESDTRLSSEEMGGGLSIFDYLAPAGFGVPRHVHHRGSKRFFEATEKANLTEGDIAGRSRIAGQFGVDMTSAPLTDSDVSKILNGQHPSALELGRGTEIS